MRANADRSALAVAVEKVQPRQQVNSSKFKAELGAIDQNFQIFTRCP